MGEARNAQEALVQALFEDADKLIARIELLDKSLPERAAEFDEKVRVAVDTLTASVEKVRSQSMPSLLQALESKAREVQAAFVAAIGEKAAAAAKVAFATQSADAAARISTAAATLESSVERVAAVWGRRMLLVAGAASAIGALVATLIVLLLR